MAGTSSPPAGDVGVGFELERLELVDGHLVVTGWWSGVRGMRFLRPTLLVRGVEVLATLEHKPWAPADERPWTASFPWDDGPVHPDEATLIVAPSVTAPLAPRSAPSPAGSAAAAHPGGAAALARDDAAQGEEPSPESRDGAPGAATTPADVASLQRERDRLRRELEQAQAFAGDRDRRCRDLEEALGRERERSQQAADRAAELERTRTAAQREEERLVAQRDEAVRDREAALRTRERMEASRAEALDAQRRAESERDEARAQRDEARRQRDEALLAIRTLERQLKAQGAAAQRDEAPVQPDAGATAGDARADEPIGVRRLPAVRTVAAELQREDRSHGRVSELDLWALRVFGLLAALCFILLLALILREFL